MMIFIIEDNEIMAQCIKRAVEKGLKKRSKVSASEITENSDEVSASEITENSDEVGASEIAENDSKVGASEIAEKEEVRIYHNAYEAMAALNEEVPELIFLDVLLDGVDGFTFLNEIMSYEDTAKIPIILVTSVKVRGDLSIYGVRGILDKETMTPKEIVDYVTKYTK